MYEISSPVSIKADLFSRAALTVGGAFLIFAALTVAAWFFTYRYLPGEHYVEYRCYYSVADALLPRAETKGLSLEATRALFEREAWNCDEENQGGVRSSARYQSVASEEAEPRRSEEGEAAEGERRDGPPSP
jgi:hypothetical protein